MKTHYSAWLESLIKENIIEEFDTTFGKYYRLGNSEIQISTELIQLLKKEYLPGFEKGGFFLASPEKKYNSVSFVIKEIRFVRNISPRPYHTYIKDPNEAQEIISDALRKNLLPFTFHSHPTKDSNILGEAIRYNKQMDTSVQDRLASLFSRVSIGGSELRLPDILVVVNGRLKSGLFIGFYGGLVAPLDFSERKKTLESDLSDKIQNSIENLFTTPNKKLIGLFIGLAFVYFLIRYPKSTLLTIATTATVLPEIAYTTPGLNKFFGISHGSALQISLPKIAEELIIKDEKHLHELFEEWKKCHYNEAA